METARSRSLDGTWTYHEFTVSHPGTGWVEEADGSTVGQYIDLCYGSLVAAAPELYRALVALQKYAVERVPFGEGHHHPVWAMVANAIAKAEGQANAESVSGPSSSHSNPHKESGI